MAQSLASRGHSLRHVNDGAPDPEEMARYVESIADPERPVAADTFAAMRLSGLAPRLTLGRIVKLAAALFAVAGLTCAWHFTALSDWLSPASVEQAMVAFAASPLAPLYVLIAYLAGALVAFPLIVLIAATAAAFGPVLGFAYALIGSMASAILMYGVGAWLGRRPLQSVFGPRLGRIRNAISRSGILAVAAVRLVPIAPFSMVNMVAGACEVRMVDYVVGTVLGLLPGLLVMSALGYQIFRFLVAPTASDLLALAGAVLVWAMLVFGAQKLATRAGSRR